MSLKKVHFLNELLEKHNIPTAYKTLRYAFNDAVFFETKNVTEPETSTQVCIAFPKFLKPTFHNGRFKTKKIIQKNLDSFGITIAPEITEISQYLNAHFSKSSRAPIIKKMKRLESCFNIHYKVFYGTIAEETYEKLMYKTHAMLLRRFEQRNDNNFILNDWNKYVKLLFPLINNRKASLFVIYNDDTPIQVSINFHYEKTFFAYIPAYDIDYAQFGLGNTAVYKQLEWCIENNYVYLDMGNGDYDYKKRWCNYQYQLETHIYYKSNSLKANILATTELNTIKIKNILKEIINSAFYNKLKQTVFSKKDTNNSFSFSNYSIENIKEANRPKSEYLQPIDLKTNNDYQEIKKPLFDFLYNTQDHIDTVSIHKIKNETDAFLITGISSCVKVTYNQKTQG